MKRLYDLVNCKNDQHRIAFYYAMRDTVVAQVRVHCCCAHPAALLAWRKHGRAEQLLLHSARHSPLGGLCRCL